MTLPSPFVWRSHYITLLLLLTLLIVSCHDDDDDSYPNLTTTFVEATTNSDAHITTLRTDDGTTYNVTQSITAQRPDTTYRCIATYQPTHPDITVYRITTIFSPHPQPHSQFKDHPHDPVHIISTWRGGDYINLHLGMMTTGISTHTFAFCEDSIVHNTSGTTTAHITLLHSRPSNDPESYTQNLYLSIPLHHYIGTCDTISLTIPTYQTPQTEKYPLLGIRGLRLENSLNSSNS